MDNILATYYADKRVDAVLSPYDGISRGIIASLKQVGYYTADKPAPAVSGQDAELPSVKSILAGEQTSTVFKDTRNLAAQAAKMVDQMLKGETVEVNNTETYDNGVKIVPSLPPGHGLRDQGQRPEGAGRQRLLHRPKTSSSTLDQQVHRGCAAVHDHAHPPFSIQHLATSKRRELR